MVIAVAFWAWTGAVVLSGALAWLNGGNIQALAGATALALAPALVGFILMPRLGDAGSAAALTAAWLVAAIGLTAGSGGAWSPLAASLLIPPALVRAIGQRWAPEVGAASILGYAFAAAMWVFVGESRAPLGPFPEMMTAAAIAFTGGLVALDQRVAPETPDLRAAMSRQIAEVSHELRTPLTHILGFAEMIENQIFGPLNERYVEYAGLIRGSGGHLLKLVNDLLDLSRIEAGRYDLHVETFDARDVIAEVTRLSTDAAEKKRIVLTNDAPQTPLRVQADEQALRRMLINVVGNAVKFTPEGGRVRIESRADGDRLLIDVSDTGPGIPEAERQRLGRPYERGVGAASAEGSGLGLALVRGLVELHGGVLSFHDAPGGGALVRISAPIVARD